MSKKTISPTQIETNFKKDLANAIKPYQLTKFVFNLNNVKYIEPIPRNVWMYGRFQANFFFKAPVSQKISLELGSQNRAAFLLSSSDEKLINEEIGAENFSYKDSAVGDEDWFMKKFTVQIKKGELYRLQSKDTYNRVVLNTANIVLFKNPGEQDFDNYAYPLQYFYVPKNCTEIVFMDAEKEGTNGVGYLIAPDGTKTKRENVGAANIYRVKVEKGWDGKLWTATFGHPTWSFKNIPNITSLQRFGYEEK